MSIGLVQATSKSERQQGVETWEDRLNALILVKTLRSAAWIHKAKVFSTCIPFLLEVKRLYRFSDAVICREPLPGFDPWVRKIPGLGRSPGEGNGNPLQDSCLENSMDGGAC